MLCSLTIEHLIFCASLHHAAGGSDRASRRTPLPRAGGPPAGPAQIIRSTWGKLSVTATAKLQGARRMRRSAGLFR